MTGNVVPLLACVYSNVAVQIGHVKLAPRHFVGKPRISRIAERSCDPSLPSSASIRFVSGVQGTA